MTTITNIQIINLGFKIIKSGKHETIFKLKDTQTYIVRNGCCAFSIFNDPVEPKYYFAGKIDNYEELLHILTHHKVISQDFLP